MDVAWHENTSRDVTWHEKANTSKLYTTVGPKKTTQYKQTSAHELVYVQGCITTEHCQLDRHSTSRHDNKTQMTLALGRKHAVIFSTAGKFRTYAQTVRPRDRIGQVTDQLLNNTTRIRVCVVRCCCWWWWWRCCRLCVYVCGEEINRVHVQHFRCAWLRQLDAPATMATR